MKRIIYVSGKKIIIIWLLLLLMTISYCQNAVNEVPRDDKIIDMIVIKHTDFSIFTIVDISCEAFENTYNTYKSYDTILCRDTVRLICDYIINLKRYNEDTIYKWQDRRMDVRAKIILFASSDTIEVCIDRFKVYYNGNFYKMSKEFREYMLNLPLPTYTLPKKTKRKNKTKQNKTKQNKIINVSQF